MDVREKYQVVHTAWLEVYGEPKWRQHLPPIDELVCTILSQNTSDLNRDRGFDALKERFPTWEAVLGADVEEIKEAIRPAGLANQKAPRIKHALQYILLERGELSLDFLADLPLNQAQDWLVKIKGIGPKTAAIILLFAFNRPTFPVDTHVHRITKRLGLIGERVSAEKAHQLLAEIGEPDTFYAFHLNAIRHGREVCQARKPKCEQCVVQNYCNYFDEITPRSL